MGKQNAVLFIATFIQHEINIHFDKQSFNTVREIKHCTETYIFM